MKLKHALTLTDISWGSNYENKVTKISSRYTITQYTHISQVIVCTDVSNFFPSLNCPSATSNTSQSHCHVLSSVATVDCNRILATSGGRKRKYWRNKGEPE